MINDFQDALYNEKFVCATVYSYLKGYANFFLSQGFSSNGDLYSELKKSHKYETLNSVQQCCLHHVLPLLDLLFSRSVEGRL